MRKHRLQRGLYLITPDARDPSRLLERVLPLLPFAACLQLRAKSMDDSLLRDAGARLREACADARVPFIVNDDARLAQELGENAIIGVSCYDDLERARTLTAQGADYLAFGAFFPSPTKPHARRASLDLLRDSAVFGLPRVAIGGITPDNAGPLVAAGADLLAVISGVFDAPDPIKAARAYLSCLQDESA